MTDDQLIADGAVAEFCAQEQTAENRQKNSRQHYIGKKEIF